MKYYIGIDGGGTKSRLLAVDCNENVVGQALGGSTNIMSNSRETVFNNLKELIREGLAKESLLIEDCISICIGSAGLDSSMSRLIMEQIIKEIGFVCPVIAVNDSLIVLAAATKGKSGAVLISGTGSIAYGMDDDGETVRVGGWGHILDDEGSGYWIGKEALALALKSFDGRGKKTILEKTFKRIFHIDYLPDCVNHVYNNFSKSDIAGYALYVEEGAGQNDEVCLEIIDRAAEALYSLAAAVIKKTSLSDSELTISGGNILNNKILLETFKKIMASRCPTITIKEISGEPVKGAICLAMSH